MRQVLILLSHLVTAAIALLDAWSIIFLGAALVALRGLALLILHTDCRPLLFWYRRANCLAKARLSLAHAALGFRKK